LQCAGGRDPPRQQAQTELTMSLLLTPVSIARVPRLLLAGAMVLCLTLPLSQPANASGNTIEVPVNIPVTVVGSPVGITGIPSLRRDLAGKRVQAAGDPAIDLIDDDGTRHHIPDPTTYANLFRDGTGIQAVDVSTIVSGPALTSGAYLAWDGVGGHPIYLVTNNQKRWITSPAVFDKFWFNSGRVRIVDLSTLSALANGLNVT
jgi:ChpA-C